MFSRIGINAFGRFNKPSFGRVFKNYARRMNSTSSSGPQKKQTGIKGLVQEYGYSALGVYLGLSCLDLPICFGVVHYAGAEKISEWEDVVKEWIGLGKKTEEEKAEASKKSPSLLTEFAVAYGIHKSLIFIRLPLTAAITPSIVNKLRALGFNIGKTKVSNVASAAARSVSEHGVRQTISKEGTKTLIAKANSGTPTPINPKFGNSRPTKAQKWWNWFF
ncbi:unnamed protein product [Kuraishia capsulata CBS 1993]|uniref:DUF1279 domain-containing protein n=1 Tax=Kuraishia capsulata CBS 1993 TaxID=1382522 RepID=W6MLC7_9ASCO|nr:uncharacterized protein KUCA_T00002888001 [Kuraishia capsulata CBS 1993]CDK26913.1 unnamed protein product [Kuraishia capsulata CBS 1993]